MSESVRVVNWYLKSVIIGAVSYIATPADHHGGEAPGHVGQLFAYLTFADPLAGQRPGYI